MLRLLTFGGLGLVHEDGSVAPRVRPPRLALLAALAAAGDRGMSRERLMGFFWADSDEGHGRHSLRQALYVLRQELGRDVVRSHEAMLSLDPAAIETDVAEFHAALSMDDPAAAVALARGPFLDGFYLPGAPTFERWVEEERSRLAAVVTGALARLAKEADAAGDRAAAVEWWRQLTVLDPLNGRFAAGYLEALAARGDRARALAFARHHEAVVRRELDTDPDPDVRRMEAKLRVGASAEVEDGEPAPRSVRDVPPADAERASGRPLPGAHSAVAANASRVAARPWARHGARLAGAALFLTFVAGAAFGRQRGWFGDAHPEHTVAVGFIRDDGVSDSLRIGPVLIDMLATNLARVTGLSVLANSRLLEVMRPGQDSSAAGYIDAARRAGARELLEGRVSVTPNAGLALEMRQVELRTGVVRRAYRVSASDRYALVDSMTAVIANSLRLATPGGSVAEATTASPMAYRFYEEGLRAYSRFNVTAAHQLMDAALREDSTFAMAAYYAAKLAGEVHGMAGGRTVPDARALALRMAEQAPERERLTITADLLRDNNDPRALAVAESLVARYPNDARAQMIGGRVFAFAGDWSSGARAFERAVALDSLAGATETAAEPNCRLCEDMGHLADMYFWWDSIPAGERVARRFARIHPTSSRQYYTLALGAARRGDSAAAYAYYRRLAATSPNRPTRFRLDLTVGAYDDVERDARPLVASSFRGDVNDGMWYYLIALRNQGRLREATLLHRTGRLPGLPAPTLERLYDGYNEAILRFERGDARGAAEEFERVGRGDMSRWSAGLQARQRTWHGTLQGMALASAGDMRRVRTLADSVEAWGRGSLFGRDAKLHHYLRGLVLTSEGRHEEAVRAYQAAIHSPSLGFTRVNYELARSFLQLGRPRDAVPVLQAALRGEVDASNLYVTRTELHELLAHAFDASGARDSAAVHYRAVVRAWVRADPEFHGRRDAAQSWLARFSGGYP